MSNRDKARDTKKSFYKEVVIKDCYMLKRWSFDFFDYIFDIGANVGIFSSYAAMTHTNAKIFAYEPCKETFKNLVEDLWFLPNIECTNEAMGDGSDLFFYDTGWSGCNLFYKEGEKEKQLDAYTVKSKTLSDIFYDKSISLDDKYFIKIDCEGGERFLLEDKKSIEVIKNSSGSGIEIHFPPVSAGRVMAKRRFKDFPSWEFYNEWMNDNFEKTHKIVYHCSNKKNGSGVYTLFNKERIS